MFQLDYNGYLIMLKTRIQLVKKLYFNKNRVDIATKYVISYLQPKHS